MDNTVALLTNVVSVAGLALCLFAGGARIAGHYHVLDFSALTLLSVGTALMVAGCLGKLHGLTHQAPRT